MSGIITLTCPSCGGRLEITKDIERFACGHCGTEHLVKCGGGLVHLAPVLEQVSKGVDYTASELAISRLDKEIESLQNLINSQQTKNDLLESQASPTRKFINVVLGLILIIVGIVIGIETKSDCLIWIFLIPGVIFFVSGVKSNTRNELSDGQNKLKQLNDQLSKLKTDRQYHRDKVDKY